MCITCSSRAGVCVHDLCEHTDVCVYDSISCWPERRGWPVYVRQDCDSVSSQASVRVSESMFSCVAVSVTG